MAKLIDSFPGYGFVLTALGREAQVHQGAFSRKEPEDAHPNEQPCADCGTAARRVLPNGGVMSYCVDCHRRRNRERYHKMK